MVVCWCLRLVRVEFGVFVVVGGGRGVGRSMQYQGGVTLFSLSSFKALEFRSWKCLSAICRRGTVNAVDQRVLRVRALKDGVGAYNMA